MACAAELAIPTIQIWLDGDPAANRYFDPSIALLLIFNWVDANRWFRFFAFFTLLTGAVSMGREWFGWRLLPQPNRL